MFTQPSKLTPIIGGALLIILGVLLIFDDFFRGINVMGIFWPLFLIGIGLLFFTMMLSGGKSSAVLAIPGSIFACLGMMMFIQNLTDHWESWAYGWTVIIFSVGLGIYIKGVYGEQERSRQSGYFLMRLGAILFIIFGLFFELIFSLKHTGQYIFPIAMILIGSYLLLVRSGVLPSRRVVLPPQPPAPSQAESPIDSEFNSQDQ